MFALPGVAATCCAACACEACRCVSVTVARRSARFAYCALFLLSMLAAWGLRDFAEPLLSRIPWIDVLDVKPSKAWYGTEAVLRLSFGNVVFFAGLALLLVGTERKSDVRNQLQNDFWTAKFGAWLLCLVVPFFLPNGLFAAYGAVARVGAAVFLMVQMVILLDFTHNWNALWVANEWYIGLLAVTLACYGAAATAAGFLYHYYTPLPDCQLNVTLISLTLIMVLVLSVTSIHPAVQGSLLPASVMGLYLTYQCFSALRSEPREYQCNGLAQALRLDAASATTLGLGLVLTLLSIVWSAVRAGSSTALLASREGSPYEALLAEHDGDGDDDADDDYKRDAELDQDTEEAAVIRPRRANRRAAAARATDEPVPYNYSFFHLIFALASMYVCMLLTGWGSADPQGKDTIDLGWGSVWAKVAAQWFTAALYLWSLVAPVLLPDRDFS